MYSTESRACSAAIYPSSHFKSRPTKSAYASDAWEHGRIDKLSAHRYIQIRKGKPAVFIDRDNDYLSILQLQICITATRNFTIKRAHVKGLVWCSLTGRIWRRWLGTSPYRASHSAASTSYLDDDWPVLSEITTLGLPLKAWMGERTQGKPWEMGRPYRPHGDEINNWPASNLIDWWFYIIPRRIHYYFEKKISLNSLPPTSGMVHRGRGYVEHRSQPPIRFTLEPLDAFLFPVV